MEQNRIRFHDLLAGFFAWITTVFFGGILLDISYSKYLSGALDVSQNRELFSEISDILLGLGFVVICTAIGTIASSWNLPTARNLFIASLLVVIFEFLIPVFFSRSIPEVQGVNIGPWLRIIPVGLASLLAFAGWAELHRH